MGRVGGQGERANGVPGGEGRILITLPVVVVLTFIYKDHFKGTINEATIVNTKLVLPRNTILSTGDDTMESVRGDISTRDSRRGTMVSLPDRGGRRDRDIIKDAPAIPHSVIGVVTSTRGRCTSTGRSNAVIRGGFSTSSTASACGGVSMQGAAPSRDVGVRDSLGNRYGPGVTSGDTPAILVFRARAARYCRLVSGN